MKIFAINFKGMPNNYLKIDNYVSRSAQPTKENLVWLREQGITDIINFRTMNHPGINFDEAIEVKNLGMNYHNIPTITNKPSEKKVELFLAIINKIKAEGGRAHIHCKAGADRTGMYSFIYKMLQGIGNLKENELEWVNRGHNIKRFPDLRNWAKRFLQNIL